MPRTREPESWGHSTVQSACPLDCPDCCTLEITVKKGRIVEIDGGRENPSTKGYICGKVRRFPERVYGEDRLLYPAVRKGTKGDGVFTRVTWDEALDQIAEQMIAIRDRSGGAAILPFCYGGSNGLLTQDTNDATLWRAFGTSRLARTVCAAATGAANMGLYGKMPGVTYEDYVHARLIVLWGVNPATSGIHLIPFIKEARKAGATLVVVDPRSTSLARQADLHIPLRPGTDVAVALALHKHLFDSGRADLPFLEQHARGVDGLRARADAWPMDRAAQVAGLELSDLQRFADLYAATNPAVIRCGWGLERNRNGGSAVAAVLALPAVAGKFGVRGGGFSMSNSDGPRHQGRGVDERHPGTADPHRQHEQAGRRAGRLQGPGGGDALRLQLQPAGDDAEPESRARGSAAQRLVHGRVRSGRHRHRTIRRRPAASDDLRRELRHRQGLWAYQPADRSPRDRARRRGAAKSGGVLRPRTPPRDRRTRGGNRHAPRIARRFPPDVGNELLERGSITPPFGGRPVQFVDVFPLTPDRKVNLFPDALEAEAPSGLYVFQPDPATEQYPLALISPASEKTVSSMLGELRERPGMLQMHPSDAAERGLSTDDPVRIFNNLGEVHCPVA